MLALLRGEPAGERVRDLIAAERSVMSWINLGEVLHLETRRVGLDRAQDAVAAVSDVSIVELPDEALVRAAAARKPRAAWHTPTRSPSPRLNVTTHACSRVTPR